MEDRHDSSFWWDRIKNEYLFWLIFISAAAIRFYFSFHTFLSDEAFNLITIEDLLSGRGFTYYFFRHPPLYILLSSLFYYLIGPYPQIPSFISIIFSVLALMPLFLTTRLLMGRKAALWSSFFFAVMPAAVFYSTWIKQDGMLLFFFMLAIYTFLRKSYVWAGIAIGLAMLVKEFAVFFFPITLLLTLFETRNLEIEDGIPLSFDCDNAKKGEPAKNTLSNRKKQGVLAPWKGWFKMLFVSVLLSAWWYIMFGLTSYDMSSEALAGNTLQELIWHLPWWLYLKNLPNDVSYAIFFLFCSGLVFFIKEGFDRKRITLSTFFPLSWAAIFYIPLTFIVLKAPWFTYVAAPPLAMVSAFGMVKIYEMFPSGVYRYSFNIIIILLIIHGIVTFDKAQFFEKASGLKRPPAANDIQGESWGEMIEKMNLWRGKMEGVEKVAFLGFRPTLQYMMGIQKSKLVLLRFDAFFFLDREEILQLARDNDIEALVVNSGSLTYSDENLTDMVYLWGEPERIGKIFLFRTGGNNVL